MRRSLGVVAAASLALAASSVLADDRSHHNDPPRDPSTSPDDTGEIRGTIAYCGPGGNAGILVHIPGRSFQSKLGASGRFILNFVPEGSYSLTVEIPGRTPHTVTGVTVEEHRATKLGTIEVCRDGDGDHFTEAEDCNDNNAHIHPGAAEQCDGLDNDCDGVVDEGCSACTDADHDGFFAQAGCLTAVDCVDSDPTVRPNAPEACDSRDNNCNGLADEDFDLETDPNNCGSCGNVCGPGSTCEAGSCTPPPCLPNGAFIKSGAPVLYACCGGLVSVSVSTFAIMENGGLMQVLPQVSFGEGSGALIPGDRTMCPVGLFDNTFIVPADTPSGCAITENVAGSYNGSTEITGRYSLHFQGEDCSCFGGLLGTPCVDSSFPFTATRSTP